MSAELPIEERYVRDDNLRIAAGVSAGIDISLYFISEIIDEETAGKIQLHAEYFPSKKIYLKTTEEKSIPTHNLLCA